MKTIKRNLPLIKSIFRQANRYKRQEMLTHTNKDQINAVSEIVLNLLKNKIPVQPPLMAQLRRHKRALREIGKKKNSVKRRREVLMRQRGSGLWTSMNHLLCQCLLKHLSLWWVCYKKATRSTTSWQRNIGTCKDDIRDSRKNSFT